MAALIGLAHTPAGAALIAAAFTAILFLETFRSPWSPFFLAHAVLMIWFSVWAGAWPRDLTAVFHSHWPQALSLLVLLCVWECLLSGFVYEKILLRRLRRDEDTFFAPSRTLDSVLTDAARRFAAPITVMQALFSGYALLWAPFGEDLFFWGYLHSTWSGPWGFWATTLAVSLIFSGHHLLYLGGRWKTPPWASLAAFAATSFISAILMSLFYRATGSVLPLLAAHAGVNALWIATSASSASDAGIRG
jgi:membrane protease YdiL (CAAX protease family)